MIMKRLICTVTFLIISIHIGMDNSYALDCMECHSDITISGAHKENMSCGSCHKNIKIETHTTDIVENVSCESCHEKIVMSMQNNIHYRLREKDDDELPDCATCHGYHNIRRPAEIESRGEYFCSDCHDNILLTNNFHSKKFMPDKSCLQCHNETKDYKGALLSSVHKRFGCVDCHPYVVNNFGKHTQNIWSENSAECSLCHKTAALEHRESIHGISLKEGFNEAARCWNCHGSHNILSIKDENSSIFPSNLAKTCGVCHNDPELVKKYSISAKLPGKTYSQSVHGKLVEEGRVDSANCVLCHGVHDIKNLVQPGSKILSFNVPDTCGNCHQEIAEEYKQSIHWIYVKKGVREAPVCNDCHSEHSVTAINTVNKNEEVKRIQEETCFICHQNPVLARRFNLEGDAPHLYRDSYHGLAASRGDSEVALCVDCHGVHKILPKSHPESTINEVNVTQTCKSCHSNATEVFSKSYSHKTASASALTIENLIKKYYKIFILIVIGGMVVHNLFIFIFQVRTRYKKEKKEKSLRRFSTNEVIQHYILLVSFIVLAFTGFALKFPDLWLFKWTEFIGMTETIRQNMHRVAGIALIGLGVNHFLYIVFTSKGRNMLFHLLPQFHDIKRIYMNILYYSGLRKEKPDFGQFDYTEKMEYWALIWGTLIMAVTGFVLAYPDTVSQWVPFIWFIKVNEVVHYYEAILATAAVFVWHFFFVIFQPVEYPMSFSWINGRMDFDQYANNHGEYIKKLTVEWNEVKSGQRKRSELSAQSKLIISDLEKNGYDPDKIIESCNGQN